MTSAALLATVQLTTGLLVLARWRRCADGDLLKSTALWLGISSLASSATFLLWAGEGAPAPTWLPVPAPAEFLHMVAGLSGAVALGVLLPRRAEAGSPARWVLDASVVAVALFVLSWVALLRDAVVAQTVLSPEWTVALVRPHLEVVALALGALVALRARPQLRRPVGWILAGLVAFAAGDVVSTYVWLVGDHGAALPVAVALWAAAYPLAAMSLLGPAPAPAAIEDPAAHRSTSLVPNWTGGVALLVALTSTPDAVLSVTSILLLVLVLARQTLAVRTVRSVSERLEETVRQRTEELSRMAFRDALTGLVTWEVLTDRLDKAFSRPTTERRPMALLVVELDKFEGVNDTYGHRFGDHVLAAVATRVRSVLRSSDTAARMGGDQFAVLLDGVESDGGSRIAHRLLELFREPVSLGSHAVAINASIGIAVSPAGEAIDLLSRADVALGAAKQAGKGRSRVFDAELHEATLARLRLGGQLALAVGAGDVAVHYQPIVDLATRTVVGFEALARWNHLGAPVAPDLFIPLAEESGLIVELGDAVLRTACHQLAAWQHQFPSAEPLNMSVNLSGRQLHEPDLVDVFCAILDETEVVAGSVRLELTESNAIEVPAALDRLHALRTAGFSLSIDDFGTGYSSLSYLRTLPVDVVKIDRSLVTGVATEDGWRFLGGIVRLVHGLGLDTLAEGVERPEQAARLHVLGCQLAQGHYFSHPLAPDAATKVLAAQLGSRSGGWLPDSGGSFLERGWFPRHVPL